MKNKTSATQILRHIIQALAFFVFPGLFILTYSSIKELILATANGNFSLSENGTELSVVIAVIPITILFGRFFCGFLCSFGAMGDLIYFISGKLLKKKPQIPKSADKALKSVKYLVLAALVILVWIMEKKLPETYNPWYVFGRFSLKSPSISSGDLINIGGALLLVIIIGSFFVERFFCRYICPLGAIFCIISKLRLFHIRKNADKCVHCGLCDRKCPMGIEVMSKNKVTSGECIDCMSCLEVCPKAALSSNAKPIVAGVAATATITGIYYAGTIVNSKNEPAIPVIDTSVNDGKGLYNDGTYTGEAEGYRGKIKVSVKVSNGFISDIDIVSSNDDAEFFNKAKNTVIGRIISEQSTNVSAVSGATFSSNGIISAVADALNFEYTNPNENSNNQNGGHGGHGGGGHGKR